MTTSGIEPATFRLLARVSQSNAPPRIPNAIDIKSKLSLAMCNSPLSFLTHEAFHILNMCVFTQKAKNSETGVKQATLALLI